MAICPECESEISHVRYECSTSGWESGAVSKITLTDGRPSIDWDYSDSGTDDCHGHEFFCPRCGNLLFSDPYAAEMFILGNNSDEECKSDTPNNSNFEF